MAIEHVKEPLGTFKTCSFDTEFAKHFHEVLGKVLRVGIGNEGGPKLFEEASIMLLHEIIVGPIDFLLLIFDENLKLLLVL